MLKALIILVVGLTVVLSVACHIRRTNVEDSDKSYIRKVDNTDICAAALVEVKPTTAKSNEVKTKIKIDEPNTNTHYLVYRVRATVKACSPQDPHDSHYYREHGFKGAAYNICSDYRVIPKNSFINLSNANPGYMDVSFPGKWWQVDAPGGSWIRNRGTRNGKVWIDVKYRTYYSAKKFGSQTILIDVILPPGKTPSRVLLDNTESTYWKPRRNR
jgi:hypothetical protein